MSSVTKVEENVRRITRNIEHDQAKRTEGCLTATCFFRYVFQKKNAREPTLRECPVTCCYHPDYKPQVKTSLGRSRRKWDQYRALESSFQATQENWREEGNYADPSPF